MDNQNPTSNSTPPTENIPVQDPAVQETSPSQAYNAPQPPTPPPSPKSFLRNKILLLIVILLIFLGLSGTYLALNSKPNQKPAPPITPTPLPTEASAKEGDPTANWKIYTDSKSGISFKYPSDYIVKSFVDNPGIIHIASSESRFNELSQHIAVDARLKDAYANYENAVKVFFEQFKIDQTHQISSASDSVIASSGPYSIPFVKDSKELYEKHYYWRYKNGAVTAHYANVDIGQTKIYDQILSTFKFTN